MIDLTPNAGPTILYPQEARPAPADTAAGARFADALAENARTRGGQRPAPNDPAWRQAVEFESVFIAQMVSHMFTGTEAEAPFGGGSAEQSWQQMMNQEYGKSIAQAGGIGIANQVYQQILHLQGAAAAK